MMLALQRAGVRALALLVLSQATVGAQVTSQLTPARRADSILATYDKIETQVPMRDV